MSKTNIKNILISQPAPADLSKSQYKVLIDKYKVKLEFFKFFDVAGISSREFRDAKIALLDYTAVIFTSKLAVDNYFRLAKELRLSVPETMKYFCITEAIANYMQNYVQYRKRKIFHGKLNFGELLEVITKHKEEKFIFPCAEDSSLEYFKLLETANISCKKCVMYRSITKDLSSIDINKFDMVVVFSPIGVKSFVETFGDNFPKDLLFAAFGTSTQAALKNAKLKICVPAPTKENPSMVMALEKFLSLSAKEKEEWIIKIESQEKQEKKKTTQKTEDKKTKTNETKGRKKATTVKTGKTTGKKAAKAKNE